MPSRCFLLEPCHTLNVDDAEEFGRVVTLFDEGSYRTSLFDPELQEVVFQKLTDFKFDEDDYIIASGQFIGVVVLLTVASRFGSVRTLSWNAKDRQYEILGTRNETTT